MAAHWEEATRTGTPRETDITEETKRQRGGLAERDVDREGKQTTTLHMLAHASAK